VAFNHHAFDARALGIHLPCEIVKRLATVGESVRQCEFAVREYRTGVDGDGTAASWQYDGRRDLSAANHLSPDAFDCSFGCVAPAGRWLRPTLICRECDVASRRYNDRSTTG
jgi:hypothetical protein